MAGRTKGATVKKAARGGALENEAPGVPEAPLRPSQCREYMRQTLAREFRGIVQGFVEGARTGSCQHVKLAAELLERPERRSSRGKGTVQRLLEKLEREAQ